MLVFLCHKVQARQRSSGRLTRQSSSSTHTRVFPALTRIADQVGAHLT